MTISQKVVMSRADVDLAARAIEVWVDDEPTKPDGAVIQQWRRLVSAFDRVPADRREKFLEAVTALSEGYSL